MKTELVNLVTTGGTDTVEVLSTELNELTLAEGVRALELAIWLIDEGWTVMTMTDSPRAPVIRKGAEAMHGTYRSYEHTSAGRIDTSPLQLPRTTITTSAGRTRPLSADDRLAPRATFEVLSPASHELESTEVRSVSAETGSSHHSQAKQDERGLCWCPGRPRP